MGNKLNWGDFMKDKQILIALIIATAIIVSALGLGFMNYKAKADSLAQKNAEIAEQKASELRMQMLYSSCINDAYEVYQKNWASSCKEIKAKDDCLLPRYTSDRWDEMHKEAEATCLKLYGSK
jgi:hypothetical protein